MFLVLKKGFGVLSGHTSEGIKQAYFLWSIQNEGDLSPEGALQPKSCICKLDVKALTFQVHFSNSPRNLFDFSGNVNFTTSLSLF